MKWRHFVTYLSNHPRACSLYNTNSLSRSMFQITSAKTLEAIWMKGSHSQNNQKARLLK